MGCGRVGHVTAVVDGRDFCQRCYEAPVRACGVCGQQRRVAARSQNGRTDVCHRCYQTRQATCVLCNQDRSQHTATWPLGPVCAACYRRVIRNPSVCAACSKVRVLIGRSDGGAGTCGPCAGAARDYVCVTCGTAGEQHFARTCLRCSVVRSAQELLADETGTVPEPLTHLPDLLGIRGRPGSMMRWLLKPLPRALMKALGGGATVTHASLDACPAGQSRHHLRSLLMDAGVLPARDEHTGRLETWVTELVATLPSHQARLISPYAQWKVLRTVRRRIRRKRISLGVASSARERVRVAVRFLRHLDHREVDVTMLTQESLDRWTGGSRSRSVEIAPFIRWLNVSGITRDLRVATMRSSNPTEVNAEVVQHTLIGDLITGRGSADLQIRVSGLFVLLYGARIDRIHQLTTADLEWVDERLFVALSADPIEVPTVLAQLIDRLVVAAEQHRSVPMGPGEAAHLFPSPRRAHEPLHPTTLGRRLARAGVRPRVARNSALLALTSDLPAAVVAAQTGLTPQTATRWAQMSQRDNIAYVAARATSAWPQGRRWSER